MSESELEGKRPEWKDCILPRTKTFDFVLCDTPPKLSEDTNMFAASSRLAYPMRLALVSLVRQTV